MRDERVLVAGWINSPHVLAWGHALLDLGYEVHLAGQLVDRWPAADTGCFASVAALPPGRVPGIRDRRIGRGLAGVVHRVRPDLVHAHWAPAYGWMAARARMRPLVTSVWGSDLLQANRRLMRRSRRALRSSDLILADSAHLATVAARIAGQGIRVEVVHWGVDLDRYRPATEKAGAPPTVLMTRALDPLYNPQVVLEAVALLRRRIPELRLILKHPGAELPLSIEARLSELDLVEATRVVGFVDEEALAELYRSADVYVSIPSSDSSPRSVWEALASGTPTVISDLPWARDVLRDGEHGLLVPIDAQAVALALERALGDKEMGERGRRLAEEKMGREVQVAHLDVLYRELLG
jgi:glycosyltransferase involved in cell wall biosynthesis